MVEKKQKEEREGLKSLGGDGAMDIEKKVLMKRWLGKVAVSIKRISNRRKIWWIGDGRQGAVPATQNLKLIAPVHGIELKKFFARELATTRSFGKMPFFPTLVIIVAEIEAMIQTNERLKAEKYARFMQYFRANKEKR